MSLGDETEEQIRAWDLPYVEASEKEDESKTNAFNRRSDWKYEPPEEIEEILPPTAEEMAAIRESAYQEGFEQGQSAGMEQGLKDGQKQGYEEGFAQGQQAGFDEGQQSGTQDIQQKIDIWQQMLNHLHQPVQQVDETLQAELVQLSVSLARAVIRTELVTNKDIIFQALSEGLKVLPIHESLYQIHLHPDDLVLVKDHFDDQEIEKHKWVFIEAPQMSRGGCDIVTQSNAVDVSIERRVKDVIDKFLLEQGLTHGNGD